MEQAAELVSGESGLKLPDKTPGHADEKESLANGDSNLLGKGQHNDEDDGAGSDGGFELIDVKENFDAAKVVEEERESPSATTNDVTPSMTMESPIVEDKNRALEEQMRHPESSILKQDAQKLEELMRRIEELEIVKTRSIKDLTEAEKKNSLLYNSLQEAQGALTAKDKELIDATQSLKELANELESSKKKIQQLVAELDSSVDKLRKLEELKDERSLHAAQEAKRASELDNMLEMTHSNMKEMENQITSFQEEIKGLHDKAMDHRRIEESLRSTISELKMVQETLELSKSQVADLELKLASQDANISKLNEELSLQYASEESLKEKSLQLENELSAVQEELEAKLLRLLEMEMKLEEHVTEKQASQATLEKQHAQILNLQEGFNGLKTENETLQGTLADLNSKLSGREIMLSKAEDDHTTARSLLSEALAHKEGLEVNLKSLSEHHGESKAAADNAAQKILELEAQIQTRYAAEEALKSQLEEVEARLEVTEKKSFDVEQQLSECENKSVAADEEIKFLVEHVQQEAALLAEKEKQLAEVVTSVEGYKEKISELESSLTSSLSKNQLLEQEVKDLSNKCSEHQEHAHSVHQRSLELESLLHASQSDTEGANFRTQELEQELTTMCAKFKEAEAELEQYGSKFSQLSTDLEAYQTKAASLEAVAETGSEKEEELTESLSVVTEEKRKLEELMKEYKDKLQENTKERQAIEERLESQEFKFLGLQEELAKLVEEKERHANTIADLNLHLSNKHDMYRQLEAQLIQAGNDHSKTRLLLSEALSHKEELEQNLKSLNDQHTESKTAVESAMQRNIELEAQVEELSTAEQSLKLQLAEIESKLVSGEKRSFGLEQELKDAVAGSNYYHLKVDELSGDLEAYKEKITSHEVSLVEAKQKEAELSEKLAQVIEEKEKFEEVSRIATIKHLEAEKQVQTLQGELESARDKLEGVENDLQALGIRESAVLEKLKSAEEQLEHKGRALEHATSKKIDLETLHQSLLENTEQKLQQAAANLAEKEAECQQHHEKLQSVEEKTASYQAKATTATEEVESLKVELEAYELEISTLESTIEELKTKACDAESNVEQALAEKEMMGGTNQALKEQLDAKSVLLDELQERFSSTHSEREELGEKLAVHERTIEHLTEVRTRGLELQSAVESRNAEIEAQLREALETIGQKEAEVKSLKDKLVELETESESLSRINEALDSELDSRLAMFDELQERFRSTHAEKEQVAEKLIVHERTIEHLTEVHSRGLELHSAAESSNAEIKGQLHEALKMIEQKEDEVKYLNDKLVAFETENKKLADTNEVLKEELDAKMAMVDELHARFNLTHDEKEEAVEKLTVHERTIAHLTEVHAKGLELQSAVESGYAEIEVQLRDAHKMIAEKEDEVKDLNEKLLAFEIENKQLAGTNKVLKEELDAKMAMVDELQEQFSLKHAENEEAVEKLAVHERTIAHLTGVHAKGLELQSVAESRSEDIEGQLQGALETIIQKEAEIKDLNKKLEALEIELGYYEEQATEAATAEEGHKVKFEEALHKIKRLEEQLSESESKIDQFHTEKENLVDVNGSLSKELRVYQKKLNEVELALSVAIAEKEGASKEIHSLRKTLDGMIQRKEELESQVASALEEHQELNSKYQSMVEQKNTLNEMYEGAKKELEEAIAKLEEQMNVDKSEKELHISKLERQITLSELKYMEEIQTMQVETVGKDEVLTAKMQEHANLLHEKDELEDQLLEVRKELDDAYNTIANQEEQTSLREIKWDAYKKHSEDQLEDEKQRAAELEAQVSALKQQLQEAETHYKLKEEQVSLREIQWETDKKRSMGELEAQCQYAADFDKQIGALTQQLQLVETRYKQKLAEEGEKLALVNAELNKLTKKLSKSAEIEKVLDLQQKLQLAHSKAEEQAKDSVESRSREFSLDQPKKPSDGSQAGDRASTIPTQQEMQEPSGIMAFKFILGVAIVSILIGVFLGKRY